MTLTSRFRTFGCITCLVDPAAVLPQTSALRVLNSLHESGASRARNENQYARQLSETALSPVPNPRAKHRPDGHQPGLFSMSERVLDLQGLTRRFGAFTAVDAVTLSVNAAEVFGLLGSNGAGKTTTIKMLTTLLPPSSGEAHVAGFSITTQAVDVRRSIGYVPQAVSVDGSLTGYENLLIFAKLYDLPRREQKARIQEALEFMNLTADGNRMVNEYSGGMVRRLEIAQSTLHRPQVLFLDEPTVGLDPIARDAVWKHLVDLRKNYRTTLFFTTHYLEEAQQYCDRIAIMHLGKVAAMGTSQELESSLGGGPHTLNDVFVHYAGSALDSGGTFRDVSSERATALRLG